jgi:hypothetical protein
MDEKRQSQEDTFAKAGRKAEFDRRSRHDEDDPNEDQGD